MRLSEAIALYVERRHADGSTYVNGEDVLRSMSRRIGDPALVDLSADEVSRFLNSPRCSPVTRRGRYSMVRRFLRYWTARDEVPDLILTIPPKADTTFLPYVYSHKEVSAILAATSATQRCSQTVGGRTLRMFLLTLYATGGTFSEVLHLTASQVDFERCRMTLSGDRRTCKRCIPMCHDLSAQLQRYVEDMQGDTRLFSSLSGTPLTSQYLISRFQRLLRIAGVDRNDGIQRSPRMQDFRATFAVHRLTEWVKMGAALDRLVPSLSAYMGYASLGAAEKYMRLAPDCLVADIEKLSDRSARET